MIYYNEEILDILFFIFFIFIFLKFLVHKNLIIIFGNSHDCAIHDKLKVKMH